MLLSSLRTTTVSVTSTLFTVEFSIEENFLFQNTHLIIYFHFGYKYTKYVYKTKLTVGINLKMIHESNKNNYRKRIRKSEFIKPITANKLVLGFTER